jgi:hypothetical protein
MKKTSSNKISSNPASDHKPGQKLAALIPKLIFFFMIVMLMFWGMHKTAGLFNWIILSRENHTALGRLFWMSLCCLFSLFLILILIWRSVHNSENESLKRVLAFIIEPYTGAFFLLATVLVFEVMAGKYVQGREFGFMGRYYPDTAFFETKQSFSPYDPEADSFPYYDLYFDESLGVILHRDVSIENFHVVDHRRRTTGQPETFLHTIYIFGGSTVFNIRATDDLTIPSLLQKRLNLETLNTYRVVNMGVPGYLLNSQLILLKDTNLRPGDIVVFYDGINNVNGIFQRGFFLYPDEDDQFYNILSLLAYRSYFYQYFLAPPNFPPHIVRDDERLSVSLEQLKATFQSDIEAAVELCDEADVTFFHFLQPTLFTVSEKSRYEYQLAHEYSNIPNGWEYIHSQGYEVLIGLNKEFVLNDIYAFDLTDALNPEFREPGQEFFFDFAHVNYEANALIAERIFDAIHHFIIKE